MKYILVTLIFCVSLISSSCFGQISPSDIVGEWQNDLGSTLVISKIKKDKSLVGYYISPSGTNADKFPLTGWVNSSLPADGKDNVLALSFTVRWGKYGSITSWTGYLSKKKEVPTITTLWNLVRPNSSYDWDHVLTGSDIFTQKK